MIVSSVPLRSMTPELLHFEAFEHGAPREIAVRPDGSRVFSHRGGLYAMPEGHWRQFEAYQQAAA